MDHTAIWWFSLNFLSIICLAFYSMMEMACVSFNKVRLQYYVSKGNKRAIWLNYLLHNPSRLFGTTLIGVNIATFAGSEFAREFYSSLGINPDFAPLTQVIIVVIFGELAPMFAARRFAENVAMLGIPLVYASAKIMTPFLWCIGFISKLCNIFVGGKEPEANIFLTQDELQKILEEQDDTRSLGSDSEDFNTITANIFNLRNKDAKQIMEPLGTTMIPSNATIAQLRDVLKKNDVDFVSIYHRDITNIVGIALPRDLIRAQDTRRVRDYARAPWFITQNTRVIQILKQFKRNNESVAIVLNDQGQAIGIIKLDDVLEEIFGKVKYSPDKKSAAKTQKLLIVERTLPGDMKIADFNSQFGVVLDKNGDLTLADLLVQHLGHHPAVGDSVYIEPFELTVHETSLLEIKSVAVKTIVK